MEVTTRQYGSRPVAKAWNAVKGLNDSQKLELMSIIIDSMKPIVGKPEDSDTLRPYTMAEIDAMLDEAEAAFEAGDYLTQDEVFHHHESVAL